MDFLVYYYIGLIGLVGLRQLKDKFDVFDFTLFRNILRQEIGWFYVHNVGELSNRLINDLDKIKDGVKYV